MEEHCLRVFQIGVLKIFGQEGGSGRRIEKTA
jgi:hypothetical protein